MINSTIIIQGIHFGLAVYILKKFLLKPTIIMLDKEAQEEKDILEGIEERKILLFKQEEEKKNNWLLFQQQVQQKIPFSDEIKIHATLPSLTYPTITKATIQNLKNEVASVLIEKVRNVRP